MHFFCCCNDSDTTQLGCSFISLHFIYEGAITTTYEQMLIFHTLLEKMIHLLVTVLKTSHTFHTHTHIFPTNMLSFSYNKEGKWACSWWASVKSSQSQVSIAAVWNMHWVLPCSLYTTGRRNPKTHSQGALLLNLVHLQIPHITTILDMPSATVRCTLKAFLQLHFLRCISPFLFTLQLLRDCDKKTSNQALKCLEALKPGFLWMYKVSKCVSVCLCLWAERCLCVYQTLLSAHVLTAHTKVSRWTNREALLSSSRLPFRVITPSPSSPLRFHPFPPHP